MKKRTAKWVEYAIVSFIITVGMFIFLYITGVFGSGFHLQDDHEFYKLSQEISMNGFLNTLVISVRDDLAIRFRPLYRLLRCIGVYFLGTNWKLWYLCKMLQISGAFSLFYIYAREKNVSQLLSLVFGALILVGQQSAIWWRLGPQESLGILLVAISFISVLLLGKQKTKNRSLLFVFSLMLLSLQKESFMMMVPAFFVLLLIHEIEEGIIDKEQEIIFIFKDFIKRHWIEIVIMISVLLIEAYIILNYVGTNSIGYAGFSSKMLLTDYLYNIFLNLRGNALGYMILLVVALLIVQIEVKKEMLDKVFLGEIIFCGYIFGTQLILHAMSGMWERYFIPWTVSIAYFIIIVFYKMICKNKKMLLTYGGILLLFLMENDIGQAARDYSNEGYDIRNCAYYIEEHSDKNAVILATTQGNEKNASFLLFMEREYGYENGEKWSRETEELDVEKVKSADIIWGYNGTVYNMMQDDVGLDLEDYDMYMNPTFELAIKK